MPSVQADEIGLGNQEDLKCCFEGTGQRTTWTLKTTHRLVTRKLLSGEGSRIEAC